MGKRRKGRDGKSGQSGKSDGGGGQTRAEASEEVPPLRRRKLKNKLSQFDQMPADRDLWVAFFDRADVCAALFDDDGIESDPGPQSNPSPTPSATSGSSRDANDGYGKREPGLQPYAVLGLTDDQCDDADIKKAYRQLSRQWHPDKNRDPGALERFQQISRAYNLIGTPEARYLFDTHGEQVADAYAGPPVSEDVNKNIPPLDSLQYAPLGVRIRWSWIPPLGSAFCLLCWSWVQFFGGPPNYDWEVLLLSPAPIAVGLLFLVATSFPEQRTAKPSAFRIQFFTLVLLACVCVGGVVYLFLPPRLLMTIATCLIYFFFATIASIWKNATLLVRATSVGIGRPAFAPERFDLFMGIAAVASALVVLGVHPLVEHASGRFDGLYVGCSTVFSLASSGVLLLIYTKSIPRDRRPLLSYRLATWIASKQLPALRRLITFNVAIFLVAWYLEWLFGAQVVTGTLLFSHAAIAFLGARRTWKGMAINILGFATLYYWEIVLINKILLLLGNAYMYYWTFLMMVDFERTALASKAVKRLLVTSTTQWDEGEREQIRQLLVGRPLPDYVQQPLDRKLVRFTRWMVAFCSAGVLWQTLTILLAWDESRIQSSYIPYLFIFLPLLIK